MVFLISYVTGCLLELLALYTIGYYLFHLQAVNQPDPLTLRPWWRNNIVARRDWLVGIPLAICALLAFSPMRDGASATAQGSWQLFGMFIFFMSANLLLLLSLALYRPTGLILLTIGAMQSLVCMSDSDPAPFGWNHPIAKLLWLAFPVLCIALWLRALQSIRRRSQLLRYSPVPLPLSEP